VVTTSVRQSYYFEDLLKNTYQPYREHKIKISEWSLCG